MEDWQIFVNVGDGARRAADVTRRARRCAPRSRRALPGNDATPGSTSLSFARPVSARTWLQASNPSERWKWDFMFQDLPPVKFEGRPGIPVSMTGIRLTEVK